MRRSTAKMIKLTARATGTSYRRLKKAFYRLTKKERHLARQEMRQAFKKKEKPKEEDSSFQEILETLSDAEETQES